MRRLLIIGFYLIATNLIYAQKNITHQELIWYGYFTTFKINEKWYFQNEFQERHYINPISQHQFLIRSHIHRFFEESGWESSLGMCFFLQNPNDPNATTKLTVPELRPHIEFGYKQKLEKVTFDHRYRVEARFFHNTNTTRTELEDGFKFGNFRFRYRIQATVPLFKVAEKKYFKFKISDEIHLNAGNNISKNVFEQNRIYTGLSIDVLSNLAFDVGYLNWFQQRSNGDFYNRNILRFTVYHKID
ncbi:MAG: DUF2490 domain-containing protein [Bacteroidales bacterium]|nr:DUF2490 domain-containing protein [Bacteroidales bacterium]